MSKSKDAFRTISEVADWLETPAHVLRFWESKFTHVKPVKRAGGRRYYRPADMKLLGGIKKLLHDDGLTIKGAQKVLREHGVKHVAALSQPLDEDLLEDEEIIAEAAYEPDAQAEPVAEAEAKVLSFPPRAEPQESVSEPATSTPETTRAPDADPTAPEEAVDSLASETASTPEADVPAPQTPEDETQTPEAPAFGGDALPAFMRRAPVRAPTEPPQAEAPMEKAATELDETTTKLTIDPVARFEPVDPPENDARDEEPAEQLKASTPAAPIFSHSMPQDAQTASAEPKHEASQTEISEESTQTTAPEAPQADPITYDVPSVEKIAPQLDSYVAHAGVLSSLLGAQRLSAELANDLRVQLDDLRALRTRMQNH